MSGPNVRLKVSVVCSKRQGYRVIEGINAISDIRSGKGLGRYEKLLRFFDQDPAKAKDRLLRLSRTPFGVEASYDEARKTLEIQEGCPETDPLAVAELLQALLPRNLPIDLTYQSDGSDEVNIVKITRRGILNTVPPTGK